MELIGKVDCTASDFRVTDPTKTVRVLKDLTKQAASVETITIPDLMRRTVKKFPDHKALTFKDEVTNEWQAITYQEYLEKVEQMAKAFIKLGLKNRGAVAVLAGNCVEWFISDLAAIHAGGIIAGIYPTNSVEACRHVLKTSKAEIIIVDDSKQLEKIDQIKAKLPYLKAVVQVHAPFVNFDTKGEGYWRWSELELLSTDDVEDEYQRRLSKIVVNECCCLIYTSGTVGFPKGVMLSHDNLAYASYAATKSLCLQHGLERIVSYLPFSHIAAQILDIFFPLTIAATVYIADKNAMKGTLIQTLTVARPTFFFGVPRVFEKIEEKLKLVESRLGGLKKFIMMWATKASLKHHTNFMAGVYSRSIQYQLAKLCALNQTKKLLGLQDCVNLVTGAAPMSVDTKRFFLGFDLKIQELYGLSESTGPHCFCTRNIQNFETVGKGMLGVETKILKSNKSDHGEICIRGRHVFMGYLNDDEKTKEAFDDDGWLRTGDLGRADRNGLVYVTGRIKELIITSGGENIPFVLIENLVKNECAAISNTILVGDKRKFLTMLITLKTVMSSDGEPLDDLAADTLKWLDGIGVAHTTLSQVISAGPDPRVVNAIQESINQCNNKAISNAQKIQKFAILPHDFSMATGELGPTLKLRRSFVIQKYNSLIATLYQ